MVQTNKCPHPKCTVQKPLERYACGRHWYSLPPRIRSAIWDAYLKDGALSSTWLLADADARAFWQVAK